MTEIERKQATYHALAARYGRVAQLAAAYRLTALAYYRVYHEPPYRAFLPAVLEFADKPADIMAELFKLKPVEAMEYLRQKGYEVTHSWKDMVGEAHKRAFTVAKATKMEMLETIRAQLQKAIDEGTSLHDFKKELTPTLEKQGFLGKRTIEKADGTTETVEVLPSRLNTIFRTNVQSAYNAGRVQQMAQTADLFPNREFVAIKDDSTTAICSKFAGKVFAADDPIWDKYTPPIHFGCRSTIRALSDRALQREGKEIVRGADYEDANDDAHAQGFATNPAMTDWTPDLSQYSPDIAAAAAKELEVVTKEPKKNLTAAEIRAMDKEAKKSYRDLINDDDDSLMGVSFAQAMANAKERIAGVSMKGLDSDEKALIAGYTAEDADQGGGWLYKVNSELRNADLSEPSSFTMKIKTALTNALRKAPKYIDEKPLVREIQIAPEQVEAVLDAQFKVGTKGEFKGFTSTTRRQDGAGFGNVKLIINNHSGRGVNVQKLSAEADEQEILLTAGTKYVVTKIDFGTNKAAVVYLDLID